MNAVPDVGRRCGLGGQFFVEPASGAGLRRLPVRGALCLALCLAVGAAAGCSHTETKAELQASASAAGSVSASMQLTEYCPKVCQRAADCGLERAKELAEISRGDDLKLIEAAKDRQKEHYFVCKRKCEAEPVAAQQRAEFERATRCLKLEDCVKFEACLHGDPADAGQGDAATQAGEQGAEKQGAHEKGAGG